MQYFELYQLLKTKANQEDSSIMIDDNCVLYKHKCNSRSAQQILPGSNQLECAMHQLQFNSKTFSQNTDTPDYLQWDDAQISENQHFQLLIFATKDTIHQNCIILLHGLNEKKWDKYLPWAYALHQKTGRAVVLFPIAFHMDRAPDSWSSKLMQEASIYRKSIKGNSNNSFVNAAISERMYDNPSRLFWSGMQTFNDVIDFVKSVRNGKFSFLKDNAGIDFFGYSIGSFLSLIMMMANPNQYFTQSKLFIYCGGMTLDRMNPDSKYILDTQASIAMQKYFAEILSNNFKDATRLGHYQNDALHPEESWFKTMLRYPHFRERREQRIRDIQSQIQALVLKQDGVAPPVEALNTLQGAYRDIDITVHIRDYDFPYSHIAPFSISNKYAGNISDAFDETFQLAADFLKG